MYASFAHCNNNNNNNNNNNSEEQFGQKTGPITRMTTPTDIEHTFANA